MLSSPGGVVDDGRGSLREKVFNFTHEKDNGRTSSIAHEIIGFDKSGI
jgi:GTPase